MKPTILYPTLPYDLKKFLAILDRFTHPATNHSYDGAYWRCLRSGDNLVLVKAQQIGDELHIEPVAQQGELDETALNTQIQHILDIDGEREAFFIYAQEHPELWQVVNSLAGMPNNRTPTVFEALMNVIIEQQIAWTAAQRGQRWLVEWANQSIDYNGQTFYAYPTPRQIAAATVEELKPLKITHRRIGLMINLAGQIASGELDLENLHAETAYNELLKIKGIGHWTAAVVTGRAFGHFPHVTHNDVALQAAANFYFYGGEGRISQQALLNIFAPYGTYAGLAAHYTLHRWVLDRYPAQST